MYQRSFSKTFANILGKVLFSCCTPKASLVGVVLRVESLFSYNSSVKYSVCKKFKKLKILPH